MTRLVLALLFALITFTPVALHAAVRAPHQIVAFVFDWDDNVFRMPTRIWLHDRRTGRERGVSTADFALIRADIGRPGTAYADCEMRSDSLRDFGDRSSEGTARFGDDIDRALKGRDWQGPVWSDFVAATSTRESARHTWLITARIHSPETIHAAFEHLHRRGLIRFVPPVENLWAVSEARFVERFQRAFGTAPPGGDVGDPSARKAAVMERILDGIEATPLAVGSPEVLAPDAHARGRYHLWGFSDDDLGNFAKAVEVLQRGVDAGRWRHVKVTVFYTGTNRADVRPHAVTLVAHAAPRPHREGSGEWRGLLDPQAGRLLQLAR